MKISKCNLKGVSFINYPLNNANQIIIPTSVCQHKHGKQATWSHCTDDYYPNVSGHGYDAEINALKYNLALSVFINPETTSMIQSEGSILEKAKGLNDFGIARFGTYYQPWLWYNPMTQIVETIPSWWDATWGESAYTYGLITQELVGTAKDIRYPSITDDMFTLTSGKYGYDSTNDVMGEIDVITKMVEYQRNFVFDNFGYKSSVGSNGYGNEESNIFLKKYFLGMRNSAYNVGEYSYDIIDPSTFELTTRQSDMTGTREEVHALCVTALQNAIAAGGWYRDFTHWHGCTDTELEDYYRTQNEVLELNDVVSLSFSTAIEYMRLRQATSGVSAYSKDNKLYVVLDNQLDEVERDNIQTTLSVSLDLTGTYWEGKNLKSSHGLINNGNNQYVIEVPAQRYAIIEESTSGEYLDFNKPNVLSATLSSSTLFVETDLRTKLAVFKVQAGQPLYKAELIARNNIFSTNHVIGVGIINTAIYDIYIGCLTKEKQSILYKL